MTPMHTEIAERSALARSMTLTLARKLEAITDMADNDSFKGDVCSHFDSMDDAIGALTKFYGDIMHLHDRMVVK